MEFCLLTIEQSCSTSFPDVVHWSDSNLVLASWQSWLPSGLNYGLRVIYITVLHAAASTTPCLIQSDLRLCPATAALTQSDILSMCRKCFPLLPAPCSNLTDLPWTALLHCSKVVLCEDRIASQQNAAVRRAEGPVASGLLIHSKSTTRI